MYNFSLHEYLSTPGGKAPYEINPEMVFFIINKLFSFLMLHWISYAHTTRDLSYLRCLHLSSEMLTIFM